MDNGMQNTQPTVSAEIGLILTELEKLDSSEHGGYYLSDGGTKININQLDSAPVRMGNELVQVHPAKYSLKELRDLQELLTPVMGRLNIQSLSVDFPKNVLEVHVLRPTVEALEEIANIAPDKGAYIIIEDHSPLVDAVGSLADLERAVITGARVKDGGALVSFAKDKYCSVTCGAKWVYNGTDTYGFVTCGHGTEIGDFFCYLPPNSSGTPYTESPFSASLNDMAQIGKVQRHIISPATNPGPYDCSLIKRENIEVGTSGASLTGVSAAYQGGVPKIGATVWTNGVWTNRSGTVLDNNATAGSLTKAIKVDYPLIPGDSGGPMFYEPFSGQTSKSITGIAKSTSSTEGFFARFSDNKDMMQFGMVSF